jgi:hypothetical protein
MILILSVSLISFIHELCQSLLWKNYVALNYGKTQIIHGNVGLHTRKVLFFGGTSKKLIQMKASWLKPRTIHIDAWREVSLVDQFSITIEDRDTAVNTASEKIILLTLEDIKKMNLKNTIIRYCCRKF